MSDSVLALAYGLMRAVGTTHVVPSSSEHCLPSRPGSSPSRPHQIAVQRVQSVANQELLWCRTYLTGGQAHELRAHAAVDRGPARVRGIGITVIPCMRMHACMRARGT